MASGELSDPPPLPLASAVRGPILGESHGRSRKGIRVVNSECEAHHTTRLWTQRQWQAACP
eukprot:scaffold171064_cov32-Tisochrysis_lutea.AAC.3